MDNLNNIKRKKLLFNGIYCIFNIKNGKLYIGSCAAKDFIYIRLLHHLKDLKNNKHCNKYLQRSFNKYGIENFKYHIIEICKPEDCLIREQYYLDLLNPKYNLCKKAGNTFGLEVTKETREKISKSNKKFWSINKNKEKMKILFKKRIRKAPYKKGYKNLNYKLSEKGKKIIKESKNKKIINLDTNEIYLSLKEASKKLNINYTYLSSYLKGSRPIKTIRRKHKLNLKYYE